MYWGLTALAILGRDITQDLDTSSILNWVMSCQHSNGGFSGSPGHDPHILYTLSALQVWLFSLDNFYATSSQQPNPVDPSPPW